MAKWGEGDPRWIVEERPDAVNVNNWHWTEKDATKWSENKLKELLCGLKIESEVAAVTLTEVDKIEGEASVNNRKAKLIYLYDWNLTMKWKGRLKGGTEECEGKITIPNLSDENEIKEVDIEISLKESTNEGEIVKQFLHHEGKETVRDKLEVYLKLLKEEFSKGVILPKKDSVNSEDKDTKDKQMSNLSQGFNQKMQFNQGNNISKSASNDMKFTSFTSSYNFQCTAEDFYRSMTDINMVQAFTRGPALLEPSPKGKFELLGGNITGSFVELVPNKKIVQNWRLKSWPSGHMSTVTLSIEQQENDTSVKLTQAGVPANELDIIKKNWDTYYWDSIKRTFGWGYFL